MRVFTTHEGTPKFKFGTGQTHTIHLQNPAAGVPIPADVFCFGSSFPGPGAFPYLALVNDTATKNPALGFSVFGHEAQGSEKGPSEAKARAVQALLAGNGDALFQVATEEEWGASQYQSMLRGMGCHPGPIDGDAGPRTQNATSAFQREWNAGVFHEDQGGGPPSELPTDGGLDDATKAAICQAYAYAASDPLPEGRFAPVASAGCVAFNPPPDGQDPRGVVVGSFAPPLPPFPCVQGDASACPVDGGNPKCTFYRASVQEEKPDDVPVFFDFQWHRQDDGQAQLTALTTLPDDASAQVTVYQCDQAPPPVPAPCSWNEDEKPSLGTTLATLTATIKGGVCFARWAPPDGYDPFDHSCWNEDHDLAVSVHVDVDARASAGDVLAASGPRPPVFSIEASGKWGYSQPPGHRLRRIRFPDHPDASGVAWLADGSWVPFQAKDGRVEDADDETVVLALMVDGHIVTLDEEASS